MAFPKSITAATRKLLWSQINTPRLNVTRNAFTKGCSAHRGLGPSWRRCVHAVQMTLMRGQTLSETLETVFNLLKRQVHVYVSQKARRMEGVLAFYGSRYNPNTLQSLAGNFSRRFLKGRKRPFYVLFGGACFVWDKERITDEEIDSCADDFQFVSELERLDSLGQVASCDQSWKSVSDNNRLKVWRRPMENSYLFEYKAFGRFTDISAKSFFRVQLDLEYRKVWDTYVIRLKVVDTDQETGSEVVHWITHYPFPMYSRDYVFARRSKVDYDNMIMTVMSRAVAHPLVPESNDHVRVSSYISKMVIRPHRTFEENGFDFILTYLDDPQIVLPTPCINWAARSGVPDFVEKLHQAALQLDQHSPKKSVAARETGRMSLLISPGRSM